MQIAIVGGGAAGFFAAIACARANPANDVSIFERGSQFLAKVRISGGGRCNVTNVCSDPVELSEHFPRGRRSLISPFGRFSSTDTVAWFEDRGVKLKVEPDGRIFPTTDSSSTIIDCLLNEAKNAGVRLFSGKGIDRVGLTKEGQFDLQFSGGGVTQCDRLLLATGGARSLVGARIAQSLGHTIVPPVPSLFSLHIGTSWIRSLPGVSVPDAEVSVPKTKLRQRGPMLITHQGVSGPVILRLSAWGARVLHDFNHRFTLRVNWLPDLNEREISSRFQSMRQSNPNRQLLNSTLFDLPGRFWEQLVLVAGINKDTRWTTLSREDALSLTELLKRTELEVDGQSLNKDEFVTCGGVDLREVNFKTMESRITPHLYFAGELLDIDGITGGFNFQSAWTTGWIAGHAMANREH
jgi:predicted Rossmann fold flavoprotein